MSFLLDPDFSEENACSGLISICMTKDGKICGVFKGDGVAIKYCEIRSLIEKAKENTELLTSSVVEEEMRKRRERVKRIHNPYNLESLCGKKDRPARVCPIDCTGQRLTTTPP